MKNIKEKIIAKELVSFSGQTFSDSKQVYEYINEMLKRVQKITTQEIVEEILQIAENSVYNMASKNAIINYAKERNIQLNKNYLTNYGKYKRKNN